MTTSIDLVLKLASALTGALPKLLSLGRAKQAKAADYFDSIAKELDSAASSFRNRGRPWSHVQAVQYHYQHFEEVARSTLKSNRDLLMAGFELKAALQSDYLLLRGIPERTALDAITLRPHILEHELMMQGVPLPSTTVEDRRQAFENYRNFRNPISAMSDAEVVTAIDEQIRKVERAAGLFRAMAARMRIDS